MFVTPAYAQAATGTPSGMGAIAQFLPLVLIFVIMYFLMIRPQQKRASEHRKMVEALKKGDTVVTQGGIVGKVTSVRDNELEVEIAPQVRVKIMRGTIAQVVTPAAPAAANA